MRRPLIAANWKMNGLKKAVNDLLLLLKQGLSGRPDCDVVICPASLHIQEASDILDGTGLAIGAQNVYLHESGAFTGEISAAMLADCNCSYVIVGHSERRKLFGESSRLVADKFAACLKQSLTPILCLGETLAQREANTTEVVVLEQLDRVIDNNGIQAFRAGVIAYEPVWAIGTGLSATPQQAQAVHGLIRNRLAALDEDIARDIRILYGGSVKAGNAADLFAEQDIDGALVGGASLVADEFIAICAAAVGSIQQD